MERVTITTEDGVAIVGDYAAGPKDAPAALLLHMMPARRDSWKPLAGLLAGLGLATLAIDLRGHGESVSGAGGKRLDHKKFIDAEHQAKMKDVEAAVRWLAEKGHPSSRLALVGASIGANLAIAYAGGHQEVRAIVALSPGLDYRGVATAHAVEAMPRSQRLLLVASEEDEYSHVSVLALAKAKGDAELKEFKDAGHGTTMFEHMPGFLDYVAQWVAHNVGRA